MGVGPSSPPRFSACSDRACIRLLARAYPKTYRRYLALIVWSEAHLYGRDPSQAQPARFKRWCRAVDLMHARVRGGDALAAQLRTMHQVRELDALGVACNRVANAIWSKLRIQGGHFG